MKKNNDLERLFEEGKKNIDARQFDEALKKFDEILGLKENHRWALYRKAFCLRKLDEYSREQTILDKALNLYQGDELFLNEQGLLYYDQGEYTKALDAFEKTLEKNRNDKFALKWKIILLRTLFRFEEAETAIKEALDQFPGNVDILDQLAFLYYYQRKYDKAIEIFDKILTDDKYQGREYALAILISSFRRQFRFKDAETVIKKALDQLPHNPTIVNAQGLVSYDQRQYDKAITSFDEVVKIDTKNEFAYRMKINSLRKMRQFKDAEKVAKEALKNVEVKAEIFTCYGLLHFDQDHYEQADTFFTKALNQNPYFAYPYINQVRIRIKMNRRQEAHEILQQLKKSFSTDLEVRERIGWFYILLNDLKNAEEEFTFILKKMETSAQGFNGLGGVNFQQGSYRAAEENFRKAVEIDDTDPIYYTNWAWALVRQERNNLSEAEHLCKRALEIDPHLALAYGCLGVIEFKKGNFRKSEDWLRTSIELNPVKGSYTDLGALYAQMGIDEEAEKNLKKALEINNSDTQAHIELGTLYLTTGMKPEALREFRQAVFVDPGNPDSHRALALALMRTDKYEEAEEVLRRAIYRLDSPKKWRLHLILSQLLTNYGDRTNDSQFYEEALEEVNKAVLNNFNHPGPHFHKGIVQTRLEDYRGALKSFQSCLRIDETHFKAERNARRIQKFTREQRLQPRVSKWAGIFLSFISILQLIVLWRLYLTTDRITGEMLMVLVPVLLGLVVVGFLLPWLTRIKLPGFEAEMGQVMEKTEQISSGPPGEIGFGKSASLITSGPQ